MLMSGRGGGGGGGGGYSGGGRGGYGSRGRQPFDPEADLAKKAGQHLHGGGRNPFSPTYSYPAEQQDSWNSIFRALGGEAPVPGPKIDQDIYDPEEE